MLGNHVAMFSDFSRLNEQKVIVLSVKTLTIRPYQFNCRPMQAYRLKHRNSLHNYGELHIYYTYKYLLSFYNYLAELVELQCSNPTTRWLTLTILSTAHISTFCVSFHSAQF